MDLRLVSYATCPFVQRAEFVLLYKALPHEITYIDLRDKPAWFLAISPRGKVPVLVVDEKAIFESQAICEFLEETCPLPPLMSQIPFYRARDRAFFTYVSEDIFPPVGALTKSADADAFASARGKLEERLGRLQEELGDRSWLSGDGSRLGMVEVAIAPSFSRLALLARRGLYSLPPSLSAVRAWGERILAVPAVPQSVPDDWEERLLANWRKNHAWILGGADEGPTAST